MPPRCLLRASWVPCECLLDASCVWRKTCLGSRAGIVLICIPCFGSPVCLIRSVSLRQYDATNHQPKWIEDSPSRQRIMRPRSITNRFSIYSYIYLGEFVQLLSSWPPERVEVGSEQHFLPPLPVDPVASTGKYGQVRENSGGQIFVRCHRT